MSTAQKKYSVADVYAEAAKLLKQEMEQLKNRPLTTAEEAKMSTLGKSLSKMVLKEMKVI